MEQWLPIDDFLYYEVSSEGRVKNKGSDYILKPIDNGNGGVMVILRRDGRGHSRLIRRLVANAFLPPPRLHSDAPVHLDGDYKNCAANNLEWRPRWYASQRTHQSNRTEPLRRRLIRNVTTGEIYQDTLDCARAIDGLEEYVIRAARFDMLYRGYKLEFV